jgi:hypothetical protein
MSDLQPRGISINIGGVERHLLFTFSAIDLIQDHFDKPLSKVIDMLGEERTCYKVAGFIVCTLINDEIKRNGGKGRGLELETVMQSLDLSMTKRILNTILKAYGVSLPEGDEDDDDEEDEDPELLNIARLLHIGTTKLGYSEAEVFSMTPKKFFALYEEYLDINGVKKNKGQGIDDLP